MRTVGCSKTSWLFVMAAVVAAPILAAPLAQAQEGTFDRTLKVGGPVDLSVKTGSGSIRVSPGPTDGVRVVGRIHADNSWFRSGDVERQVRQIEQNPPVEQRDNVVRIGWFKDDSLPRGVSISYEVTVPVNVKVDARTGSGSITIGRVSGAVLASTGSGTIEVGAAASLDAHTGSGSIRAEAVAGSITASSGSGSIRIGQAGKGAVDVSASSGDITLSGVDGAARVSSSSGGISIGGRPSGPWSIHASSGSVGLELPADAAFDLDASSSSGGIESTHPVTMTGTIEKHKLRGRVRTGGPLVEIRTSSGSIRIR
jgi:hypothetical protein